MNTLFGRWNRKISISSPAAAINANSFVGLDGEQCAAGAKAAGIAEPGYNAGQRADFAFIGLARLKAGSGGWSEGDELTSDADGYGVVAGDGDSINAVAISDVAAGDVDEVLVQGFGAGGAKPDAGDVYAPFDVTLSGGTKDTTIAGLPAGAKFLLTRHTIGGTAGNLSYDTTGAGHLVVNSSSGSDTSVVTCLRVA